MQTMDKPKRRKMPVLTAMCVLGAVICAACVLTAFWVTRMLPSQYEHTRWKGESEAGFAQISAFLPEKEKLTVNAISTFRNAVTAKLDEASVESSGAPFIDCWSCEGSAKVYGERNDGTASVIAVGGEFFAFHPLRLTSGSYIAEGDVMKDNVLLDEDLAWFLFGGTDLAGIQIHIGDRAFRIGGVVAREDDFATKKAYKGGTGLFMSYDAFAELGGDEAEAPAITCYEITLPNPVDGFALSTVENSFPIGTGEFVDNTQRFGFWRLMGIAVKPALRAMSSGVPYPYWENAARYAESYSAFLLLTAVIAGLVPELALLSALIANLNWGRKKLSDEILPEWREEAEELIRRRQRERWEKEHMKKR